MPCIEPLAANRKAHVLFAHRAKMDGPYDSRFLPVLLAVILMVALLIVFSGAVAETAGWT